MIQRAGQAWPWALAPSPLGSLSLWLIPFSPLAHFHPMPGLSCGVFFLMDTQRDGNGKLGLVEFNILWNRIRNYLVSGSALPTGSARLWPLQPQSQQSQARLQAAGCVVLVLCCVWVCLSGAHTQHNPATDPPFGPLPRPSTTLHPGANWKGWMSQPSPHPLLPTPVHLPEV